MRRRLLTSLLVLAWACAAAQPATEPPTDRSPVAHRAFRDSAIQAYQADKAFRYDQPAPADPDLLGRLASRFWAWVDRLLQNPGVDTGFRILSWVLPITLLLYAILRLTGMEKALPWRRENRHPLPFDLRTEDVRTTDFPAEIALAVAEDRFRDATRLQYLHALRRLTDSGRIRWTPDKTNSDYSRELEGGPLAAPFREVTGIYECAWYGEMPVTQQDYAGISDRFHGFLQRIGT